MKSEAITEPAAEQLEEITSQEDSGKVHLKSYLLVIAVNMIFFAHVVNIVGSGALSRNIVAVVGGADKTVWFTSIMALLGAILSPPVSHAADYWGRKWFLVFFPSVGAIGSIVVGRAQSIGVVLLGFVLCGMALGAQPLVPTISSEVLPRKQRAYAQAAVNGMGSLGLIVGLLMGSALTNNGNNEGFRVHFYISAGIFAGASLLCAICYNPPPRDLQVELKFREKLRRLDWPAYFLLTSGAILFCVGLSYSQNPYSWSNAHVCVPFAVGVSLLIGLVLYARYVRKDGMIDHRLFRHRNYPIALGCLFVEGVCFFSANNYLPFEAASLFTTDSFLVGLPLIVSAIATASICLVGAAYSSITKTVRPVAIVAYIFYVIFYILAATISVTTPAANFYAYPIFIGGGVGLCLASLMTAAQFATPLELISTTTGLAFAIRNLGGAVGLALFNAVYNAGISSNLEPKVTAATVPLGLPTSSLGPLIGALLSHNPMALAQVPGATSKIIAAAELAVRQTEVISFRYVWVTAGSFAMAAAVASVFVVDPRASFNGAC